MKLSLEIEEDYDFELVGICCHLKDYRLCWEINRSCKLNLVKGEDLELKVKNELHSYSFYEFQDADNLLQYYLINNRGEYGYLIPEEKNCDYLLLVKGNVSQDDMRDILQKTNEIKQILATYPLHVQGLKSKKNLIF